MNRDKADHGANHLIFCQVVCLKYYLTISTRNTLEVPFMQSAKYCREAQSFNDTFI